MQDRGDVARSQSSTGHGEHFQLVVTEHFDGSHAAGGSVRTPNKTGNRRVAYRTGARLRLWLGLACAENVIFTHAKGCGYDHRQVLLGALGVQPGVLLVHPVYCMTCGLFHRNLWFHICIGTPIYWVSWETGVL
jgi:hypothetical protein